MEKRPQDVPAEKAHSASPPAHPGTARPAPRWSRWEQQGDVPAPPPVWTRYIESRLRQFGEGR